jgi:predicted transcriptional regulator of viral defense system
LETNRHTEGVSGQERHSFRTFSSAFAGMPVIPLSEIRLRFPEMHRSRLSQWQERGLLQKVRQGFYRLADRPLTEAERLAIANAIHAPSYVSLRTALGAHGFIPEGVFHVESVTTLNTKHYAYAGTEYSYRHVRPSFYFGYQFVQLGAVRVMMAGPEKALLDLLYLEPDADGPEAFEAWRLNADDILEKVDLVRMDDFAASAGSRALSTRYRRLKKWLHDHTG